MTTQKDRNHLAEADTYAYVFEDILRITAWRVSIV